MKIYFVNPIMPIFYRLNMTNFVHYRFQYMKYIYVVRFQ
nr:MAG TPA: hypothetical protein [Crassvirales sp.]